MTKIKLREKYIIERDPQHTQLFVLSDFSRTVINIINKLNEKMENFNREMETIKTTKNKFYS